MRGKLTRRLPARIATRVRAPWLVLDALILAMIVPLVLASAKRNGDVLDGSPRSLPTPKDSVATSRPRSLACGLLAHIVRASAKRGYL